MSENYPAIVSVCLRHADRLNWAMQALRRRFPLDAAKLNQLDDMEQAILDQFSTRFAKLQDAMGAKLFPAVLELVKEPGELPAFVDKLNRLEKIGAVVSADRWLMMREIRNQFSHDYPDDPELRSAMLNKPYVLAEELLAALFHIEDFAANYLPDRSGLRKPDAK